MAALYTEFARTSTNEEATGWFPDENDFEDMAEHDAITNLNRLSPDRRMAVLHQMIADHERSMEFGGSGDGIPFPD